MINKLVLLTLFCLMPLLQSCASTMADASLQKMEPSGQSIETAQEQKKVVQFPADGRVNYQGVSFSYNPQVFEIKSESIIQESLLDDETAKPGTNFPNHIAFTLQIKNKLIEPEARIRIMPIADYRRMYAISKAYTKWFDENLKDVRMIIKNKNYRTKRSKEVPYLPYAHGTQVVKARVGHFSFGSGKGFFFLTIYNQDIRLVTNEELVYVFQGISDDGKKYILAKFPVLTSFLPDSIDINEFEGYKVPERGFIKTNRELRQYRNYISDVTRKLETLPAEKFQPNLKHIEELISSLKVER